MDPAGSLHGTGSFGGTWSEPKATLSAEGGDLRVAGQTFSSARFELSLEGPSVRAETVELVQSKGKLTATGAYDRRERHFSLGVQGRSFEIAALPPGLPGPEGLPLAGSVDVDFEGGGTMAAPEGRGRVTLAGGSWEGRSLGPIAADLGLTKEGLRAEVTADDFSAHAQVTLGLAAPHAFSAAAQLEDTDLAKAAKLLGQDDSLASGTVTLAATATGSANDVRGATVELTLGKLSGILRGQPVRLGAEARLETSPGQLRVTALDVSVGEGRLVLDGALDARGEGTLKGKLQGRLGDLARIVAPMADATEARFDGNALVSFAVSGALDRPRVFAEGSLDEGIFRFDKPPFGKPERPPLEHLNAKGSLDEGTLRLDHLEAAFAGASLTATGEVTVVPSRGLVARAAPRRELGKGTASLAQRPRRRRRGPRARSLPERYGPGLGLREGGGADCRPRGRRSPARGRARGDPAGGRRPPDERHGDPATGSGNPAGPGGAPDPGGRHLERSLDGAAPVRQCEARSQGRAPRRSGARCGAGRRRGPPPAASLGPRHRERGDGYVPHQGRGKTRGASGRRRDPPARGTPCVTAPLAWRSTASRARCAGGPPASRWRACRGA